MAYDVIDVVCGGGGRTQGALRPQDRFQSLAHFLLLHEVSPLRRRPAEIDCLDETSVIFPAMTRNLLREFICMQASLGGDPGPLFLFFEVEGGLP